MAKVAAVLTDLFEDIEFTSPRDVLVEAGHDVLVVGPKEGEIAKGKQGDAEIEIEVGIDDAKAEEYDALLIPGGFSPDELRADERFF